MTQQITTPQNFTGDVPQNLQCGFCRKPVEGAFYRTMNRFACAKCAGQVAAVLERNALSPKPFFKAAAAGLAIALACAGAWAAIVYTTHFEIGIVASFIGVAVGKVILRASGKRRGNAYQWLASSLAILAVVLGKLALVYLQIVDVLKSDNKPATPVIVVGVLIALLIKQPSAVFQGFDLLWTFFAGYFAWRLCKAPPITVAGPFPLASAPAAGLQFNTIERPDLPAKPGAI